METNVVTSNGSQLKGINCVIVNGVGYPLRVIQAVQPKTVNTITSYTWKNEDVVPTLEWNTSTSIVYEALLDNKKKVELVSLIHDATDSGSESILDSEDFQDYLKTVVRKDGKDTATVFEKAVSYVKRIKARLEAQEAEQTVENSVAAEEAEPIMDIIKDADEANTAQNVELVPNSTSDGVTLQTALDTLDTPAVSPVHVSATVAPGDLLTVEEEAALVTVTEEEVFKMNKKLKYINTLVANFVDQMNEDGSESSSVATYRKNCEQEELDLFNAIVDSDINAIFGIIR